jgi:hypothetical protein
MLMADRRQEQALVTRLNDAGMKPTKNTTIFFI